MQAVQGKDMNEAVQSLDVFYSESWKCKFLNIKINKMIFFFKLKLLIVFKINLKKIGKNMEAIEDYNKSLHNKKEINAHKGDLIGN